VSGAAGGAREQRIALTLQYVTDQQMEPVKKRFTNVKDAFACFGPSVLMHRSPPSCQSSASR